MTPSDRDPNPSEAGTCAAPDKTSAASTSSLLATIVQLLGECLFETSSARLMTAMMLLDRLPPAHAAQHAGVAQTLDRARTLIETRLAELSLKQRATPGDDRARDPDVLH
ncbi:MAG: hypothetical protein KDK91_04250 [Gammaproteobacteria bacterium]|nr:hypothetical protein [Gammaproteobacteria bacterium]